MRQAAKISGLWESAPLFREISSKVMEKYILKGKLIIKLIVITHYNIDLFSLGGLFSHCRPRNETLENSCFQIYK